MKCFQRLNSGSTNVLPVYRWMIISMLSTVTGRWNMISHLSVVQLSMLFPSSKNRWAMGKLLIVESKRRWTGSIYYLSVPTIWCAAGLVGSKNFWGVWHNVPILGETPSNRGYKLKNLRQITFDLLKHDKMG